MRDRSVDREHDGRDQKTQNREMPGRISAQTRANPRECRCPQDQGDAESNESTSCEARHREFLNIEKDWLRIRWGATTAVAITSYRRLVEEAMCQTVA